MGNFGEELEVGSERAEFGACFFLVFDDIIFALVILCILLYFCTRDKVMYKYSSYLQNGK